MKRFRLLPAILALAAVTASGCFLISGQFLLSLHLPSVSVDSGSVTLEGLYVDFTEESAYRDNKDKIKALADLALLGTVANGSPPLTLEVYMRTGNPGPLSAAAIRSTGTRVWGPLTVAADEDVKLTWDRSARLFGAGKAPLLAEIKAGRPFTLYVLGPVSGFDFDFLDGVFVAVLDAAN